MLVSRRYSPFKEVEKHDLERQLKQGITKGELDAQTLIAGYCHLLYKRHGTYEAVAQRTQLDRRTAKKYINQGMAYFKRDNYKRGDGDKD